MILATAPIQDYRLRIAITFFILILSIDYYLWRFTRPIFLKKKKYVFRAAKFIHFGITYSALLSFITFNFVPVGVIPHELRMMIAGTFTIIYFTKLIVVIVFLVGDLVRLVRWTIMKLTPRRDESETVQTKISRSEFLAKTGLIIGAAPLVIFTDGMLRGAYNYKVRHVNLVLPKLPPAFNGLRILQISDVHAGSFTNKDAVRKGIKLINDQKADLVFFTGDLVNNKTDEVYEYMEMFSEIKAPMGVFSIYGNHDYGEYDPVLSRDKDKLKANLEALANVHKDMGWTLLRNEHEVLSIQNQKIGLLGVENWGNKARFQRLGDIDKAKEGLEEVPVKLLLSHDPSHWDAVVRPQHPDIDVTFSGHTHGMQFGIDNKYFRWSPAQYMYDQWADLYEKKNQYIYVNRGFGFLGFPGRVGIMPEITVFELKNG
jgi:predicted MPP superfamily phosphohydrolase